MINHTAIHLAVRAHAFACVVATTGSTTLEATATGYARAAGSFLTDGFAVGMEVTPSGFTQTATGVIEAVTALTMTMKGGRTAQASGAGRSLIAYLPSLRGYENKAITPVAREPYCTEEYLPGGASVETIGANADLEVRPTYVLNLFAPQDTGIGALSRTADALITHCAPKTAIAVGADVLRVRGDVVPSRTAIRQLADGWAVCSLSIPLRLRTLNTL